MNRNSVEAAERELQWASQRWAAVQTVMLIEASRLWSEYSATADIATAAQKADEVIKMWQDFAKKQAHRKMGDVRREWAGFLVHANRVLTKLGQGAKDGHSQPWFGTIIHQRRTDPLLLYIHQARDASEHGDVVLGQDVVLRNQPATVIALFTPEALTTGGGSAGSSLNLPTVSLLAVTNRSRTYKPPMEHLGQPIRPTIEVVAQAMLAFLTEVVAEARRRIVYFP